MKRRIENKIKNRNGEPRRRRAWRDLRGMHDRCTIIAELKRDIEEREKRIAAETVVEEEP